MALDWSKNISFSGLVKRRPKPKAVYPSKTYINLMVRDKREMNVRDVLPKALVLLLVVVLFCKFGIFDFYGRVGQKQAELNSQERVLNSMQTQLQGYDEVKAEYDMYESTRIVSVEGTVSVHDAMSLVDKCVAPLAKIASIDIRGNTVSLSLADVSLDKTGKIVSRLYEQPMVANVSVSTAASGQGSTSGVIASMVITLQVVDES